MYLESSYTRLRSCLPTTPVPYSSVALRQDIRRIRSVWTECQSNRSRDAIYAYLSAVYDLVAWWAAEGRDLDRARRGIRLLGLKPSSLEDPFAAIVRCTADPEKADKRTRSKWSRVMRYAAEYKAHSEPLASFIKRKGGINECTARFSHCLGRSAANGTRGTRASA
jgi:hypothetical protein